MLRFLISVIAIATFSLLAVRSKAEEKPLDSLKMALELHPFDDSIRVLLLNNIGFEYWIVNPIQSIIYGQRAQALATAINDSSGLAFSHRVIGVGHWARASYDKALSNLQKARELYEFLDDSLGSANTKMNMGLVYADQRDFRTARQYYESALGDFLKLGANSRAGTTYTKLASLDIEENNLERASGFLRKAIRIHQNTGFKYGTSEAFNRLAVLLTNRGEYDSADFYFLRSMEIGLEIGDNEGLAKSMYDRAHLLTLVGRGAEATKVLEEGAEVARSIGSNKWLRVIFDDLRSIYREEGDQDKALFYYDRYLQLQDSIYSEESIRNLAQIEAEIATAESEKLVQQQNHAIEILEERTRVDRLIRVSLVLGILLMGLVSYVVYNRFRARAGKRQKELQREIDFKNQELTSYTINFVQKNQILDELSQVLQAARKGPNEELRKSTIELEKIIQKHVQVDKDWHDFKLRFQSLHRDFFNQIQQASPQITNGELKLCALIKLNLSNREIANVFGISDSSVKTARYRLKKKLELPPEKNIEEFLSTLD